MKRIRVCICDYDRQFAGALAKAVALRCKDMEVCLYPGKDTFGQFDVVLLHERDRSCMAEELCPRCLFFVDEPIPMDWDGLMEQTGQPNRLYKYESVSKIIGAIRLFYGRGLAHTNPLLTIHDPPKLIGVCSGAGGVGCTSAAIAIGRVLAEDYREKVLFLSLEDMDSSASYLQMEADMPSVDAYLYSFFTKKEKDPPSMLPFLHTDFSGLQAFFPSGRENQWCRLHMDALYRWLEDLGKRESYTYVVLDLSTVFTKQQAYLLQCCDARILWGTGDHRCQRKNQMKLAQLEGEFAIDASTMMQSEMDVVHCNERTTNETDWLIEQQRGKAVRNLVETIREQWGEGTSFGDGDYGDGTGSHQ